MRAYSPYDNLPPAGRPAAPARHRRRARPAGHVLGAGQVGGPAARDGLRVDDRLLLRMELGAGAHVGPSGRYGHLRYEAEVYAWVLDTFERSDSR